MKLILIYRDQGLGDAWAKHFGQQVNVTIMEGDICNMSCDAVVSPANSFGFMDGGLDLALSERFGWGLQDRPTSVDGTAGSCSLARHTSSRLVTRMCPG